MLSLWKNISNFGISETSDIRDANTIRLLNQISVVSIFVFIFSIVVPSFLSGEYKMLIVGIINVSAFSFTLILNYLNQTNVAKHFILLFGIFIVTLLSANAPPIAGMQVNYVTLPILSILIFNNLRTTYRYYTLIVIGFFLSVFFQRYNYPTMSESNFVLIDTLYINIFINFFLMSFLLIYFFRSLQTQYEQRLLEKNEELRETNDQLKKTQSQLIQSERMASIGQLTAGIAHEINNPINFVISSISPIKADLKDVKKAYHEIEEYSLQSSPPVSLLNFWEKLSKKYELQEIFPEIDELFEGVLEGAMRTKEIVAGLREFTRLDEEGFKQVDLCKSLDNTVAMVRHLCGEKIRIHKAYEKIPIIEGIPGKINQVFMNLLENAIHSIREKGDIFINMEILQEEVQIHFRDTGIGVPKEIRDKIFEPFFTTKDVGLGKGLGLSISLGIIHQHGGKLWLNSSSPQGSQFCISFPLHGMIADTQISPSSPPHNR